MSSNVSDEVKTICNWLWDYYFELNKDKMSELLNDADYEIVNKDIRQLQISRMELNNNNLTIYLNRPGIFIGEKGKNIDAFRNYLLVHYKKRIDIKIIEDRLPEYLYHYPYWMDDGDWE
jgi:ribosomal protein S3